MRMVLQVSPARQYSGNRRNSHFTAGNHRRCMDGTFGTRSRSLCVTQQCSTRFALCLDDALSALSAAPASCVMFLVGGIVLMRTMLGTVLAVWWCWIWRLRHRQGVARFFGGMLMLHVVTIVVVWELGVAQRVGDWGWR